MPRYRKPPIVEAWIGIDFTPKPSKVTWHEDERRFRSEVHAEFPRAQFFFSSELQVEESEDGSMPIIKDHQKKLDLIRMRTEDGKRVLQLGDDRMAVNTLEGGSDYAGFDSLLGETLRHLKTYRKIYEPVGIRKITTHLTDMIEIPIGDVPAEIEDYFEIARNLPENPFGMTMGVLIQYKTEAPHDQQPMNVGLGRVPSGSPKMLRFRMDWEKSSTIDGEFDEDLLRGVLTTDNDFLVDCFESSLTSRTLDLFEPLNRN